MAILSQLRTYKARLTPGTYCTVIAHLAKYQAPCNLVLDYETFPPDREVDVSIASVNEAVDIQTIHQDCKGCVAGLYMCHGRVRHLSDWYAFVAIALAFEPTDSIAIEVAVADNGVADALEEMLKQMRRLNDSYICEGYTRRPNGYYNCVLSASFTRCIRPVGIANEPFSVTETIRLAESHNIDIKCLFMTPEGLAEAGIDAQADYQLCAGDW